MSTRTFAETTYEDTQKTVFLKKTSLSEFFTTNKEYWGLHHNHEGKVALYASDSPEYEKLLNDKNLTVVKAMKSSR